MVYIHDLFVEWSENVEVMAALDDLVLGGFSLLDNFLATLSEHDALMNLEYSTLLIVGGIYSNAYNTHRLNNKATPEEAHHLALAYLANHPISQSIASQATKAAIDQAGV